MQHVGQLISIKGHLIVCPLMLNSLTVETSGRGSHALESLTAHKITTFRCKYLATMAMATGDDDDDDDDDDEDGATTTTTTTTAARRAMGYNDDGGGRR
jgi:hypothetical protein